MRKTKKELQEQLDFMLTRLGIGKKQQQYISDWFFATLTLECKAERQDAYDHGFSILTRTCNEILKEVSEEAEDTYGNGPETVRTYMKQNNIPIQ